MFRTILENFFIFKYYPQLYLTSYKTYLAALQKFFKSSYTQTKANSNRDTMPT